MAEKAPISPLVVGLAGIVTLFAHRFSTTEIDDHVQAASHRFEAGGAAERVVIGVEDALERNRGRRWRGRIRRHCSALLDARRSLRSGPGTKVHAQGDWRLRQLLAIVQLATSTSSRRRSNRRPSSGHLLSDT